MGSKRQEEDWGQTLKTVENRASSVELQREHYLAEC